ncbi:MAG: LacI family DNA-binding transcriptional regulator [Spirochaetes bacterium]|nr:LacI family DNA-binding transcriptional regulator [Spirochaetota bacterium]
MVKIKDIAEQSGYGAGTVSRALNGGEGVSPRALKSILETAERMGYSPNTYARNLAKGDFESVTVGLLTLLDTNQYLFEMLRGMYTVLNNKGYNILMFSIGKKRDKIISHIISENLCGLIVIATPLLDNEKQIFNANKIPYIYLDHYEDGENSISVDNFRGGAAAAEYLLSKGCTKIAYIGETRGSKHQDKRLKGFESTLKKNGLFPTGIEYVNMTFNISYSDLEKRTVQKVRNLIAAGADGIFCYCDELALVALDEIRKQPREIFLVGYDDIPAARHVSLTTVNQPLDKIGEEAAKAIISLSAGESAIINKRFRPKLIIRNT